MPFKINLRCFRGPPTRGKMRKFADDQRLNIGLGRLFIVDICAYVADVRIREAHDLP